jgi:UDP-glucose 4-epimerase
VPPDVVLVTGVSRRLGGLLAGRLADEPSISRVIGVDSAPPPRELAGILGRTEFVRADIRNPLITKVISAAGVDTVVHLSITATPRRAGGRASMKEMNVIGTMQLLAACQKSASVRRLVVKSTTAVYGSSSRDPAVFTEETAPKALPRSGYAKDAVEVEGYVRGFVRRRPDVAVGMLRFANFIGPRTDSPLVRYLGLPLVPTILGYDPRVQLLHEEDALEVIRLAALADGLERCGTLNVGGDGVLLLSQMIRRAGRVPVPVPAPAVQLTGRAIRRTGLVDFSPEQLRLLEFGRVVDTTRLRKDFGYVPRHTTMEAFDDFVAERAGRPVVDPAAVERVERGVLGALDAVAGVASAAAIPSGSGRG